jgi:hypothetical protein
MRLTQLKLTKTLEATPGIEPGYTALQAAASPLRHVAEVK